MASDRSRTAINWFWLVVMLGKILLVVILSLRLSLRVARTCDVLTSDRTKPPSLSLSLCHRNRHALRDFIVENLWKKGIQFHFLMGTQNRSMDTTKA
jgi:hypothetical protein